MERDTGPIMELMFLKFASISKFSRLLGRIMYGLERFAEAEPLRKIPHSLFTLARFSFQQKTSPWPTAVNSFHSGTNRAAAQKHRLLSPESHGVGNKVHMETVQQRLTEVNTIGETVGAGVGSAAYLSFPVSH